MEGWPLLIAFIVIGLMALLINLVFLDAAFRSGIWFNTLIMLGVLALIDFVFFMMFTTLARSEE